MSDRAAFITVEDVTLQARGGETYSPVSWEIRNDEQWAVVGPNGSGKSSLMRAVCGQAPLAGGKIAYHFMKKGSSSGRSFQDALPQDQIAYGASLVEGRGNCLAHAALPVCRVEFSTPNDAATGCASQAASGLQFHGYWI